MIIHSVKYDNVTAMHCYECFVDCDSELITASYQAFEKLQNITMFDVMKINGFMIYNHNKIQIDSLKYPTQIYSKMLRTIRINDEGVSLNNLTYDDLT